MPRHSKNSRQAPGYPGQSPQYPRQPGQTQEFKLPAVEVPGKHKDAKVQALIRSFPGIDRRIIWETLAQCKGNMIRALEILSEMFQSVPEDVKQLHQPETVRIYFEKQKDELCMIHSVNALLQDTIFNRTQFDTFVDELTGGIGGQWQEFGMKHGNYDVNVLNKALLKVGLEATWFDSRRADLLPSFLKLDIFGLILNVPIPHSSGRHWLAVKRFGRKMVWFNLDSRLKEPSRIGNDQQLCKTLKEELARGAILMIVNKQKPTDKKSLRDSVWGRMPKGATLRGSIKAPREKPKGLTRSTTLTNWNQHPQSEDFPAVEPDERSAESMSTTDLQTSYDSSVHDVKASGSQDVFYDGALTEENLPEPERKQKVAVESPHIYPIDENDFSEDEKLSEVPNQTPGGVIVLGYHLERKATPPEELEPIHADWHPGGPLGNQKPTGIYLRYPIR